MVQRGVEGEEGFHLKNKQTNQKEDPKSSCASVFPLLEEVDRKVKRLKGTDTPNSTCKLPHSKCS